MRVASQASPPIISVSTDVLFLRAPFALVRARGLADVLLGTLHERAELGRTPLGFANALVAVAAEVLPHADDLKRAMPDTKKMQQKNHRGEY